VIRRSLASAAFSATLLPAIEEADLSSLTKKWITGLLKLAVCAGALWYLSGKVTLNDYVRLAEQPDKKFVLVKEHGESLLIKDPDTGQERTVGKNQLADRASLKAGQRDIERGLKYIVRRLDLSWAVWAVIALAPTTFIMAWRLRCLLATQDIALSYRDSLLLTFAGNFFNFAMPGTTGGDIYKAYHIAKRTHKRTEGITVIILDRVFGLVSFLLLAAVTIFASWNKDLIGNYGRWVGYLTTVFLIACVLFFSQRFRKLIGYEKLLQLLPMADKLNRIDKTTMSLRYHRQQALASLAVTLMSHVFIVLSIYFLARGLGIHPTGVRTEGELFQACLLATVVGYLFAAIPISIQGFGLLEAVFLKVLVEGHWATPSQMLALTLGARVVQIIWSIPGIIVPWLGFDRPTTQALEEQEVAAT
jgi:uncharacterized protein (TIRG00374 family)